MKRILEPELMEGEEQSLAYAQADFEQPHSHFVKLLQEYLGKDFQGYILDLGCGSGDITIRVAKAYPNCIIHGIDGSAAMLKYAHQAVALESANCRERIEFIQGIIPDKKAPLKSYDLIISNSLLHHLHYPEVLWQTIKQYSTDKTPIFVMDLLRPPSLEEVSKLAKKYVNNEPEILKRDFYNSLCAAFEIQEIEEQLKQANLANLSVKQVSDRHVVIKSNVV